MYCNRNKIVASNVGILLADTIDIHAIQLSNNRGGSIIRGCPHYASRRRASRRGPSGVVCLDTWAMRRDYSRLQA